MKKTSSLCWFIVISLIISSCNSQGRQPMVIPSSMPDPSTTAAQPATRVLPTATPKPTLTPTVTLIPPYPTKQVLFEYIIGGFHTPFELLYKDEDRWINIVLYKDGQLIIPYQQKILSKDEINQFLSQLEAKGLYSLDPDHLYDFGGEEPPRVYDGTFYCVSVTGDRERNLCAYEPHESFLIPEMKNLLHFLDNYYPNGMTPYSPDRILLWVQLGRSPENSDLPKESISWKDNLPSLETTEQKLIYVEGDTAKEIYELFGGTPSFKVFVQDGIEYTVLIDIVLPHEEITNRYEQ